MTLRRKKRVCVHHIVVFPFECIFFIHMYTVQVSVYILYDFYEIQIFLPNQSMSDAVQKYFLEIISEFVH